MKTPAVALTALIAPVALGAEFTLDDTSHFAVSGSMSMQFSGTLIGDWDAETNPDGTQTRPGLWGGDGNQPIPIDIGFAIPIVLDGPMMGSMDFSLGEVPGTCLINDADWTVDSSGDGAAVTVSLLYDTFRSINPDSLFVGGFPIELPIGETTISDARFVQMAPGGGTADEVPGAPGTWDVVIAVPGVMSMTLDILGTPYPVETPITVALSGVYSTENEGGLLQLSAAQSADESFDLPGEGLPTIPFEMPTILPPGDTAGVLLDLAPQSGAFTSDLSAVVSASGDDTVTPGDANGDGLVNADDILAVLSAWGPCDGCSEDLNGDGVVNVNEILDIIANWG